MRKLKAIVGSAITVASLGIATNPTGTAQAALYGCRALDFNTYAQAKCEGSNGVAPTQIKVNAMCVYNSSGVLHSVRSGSWVTVYNYTNVSTVFCPSGTNVATASYSIR